jgi:PEP-CTERM motif
MSQSLPSRLVPAAAAVAMMFLSGGAAAQGTFTPGSGTSVNCDLGTTYLATKDCSVGTVSATMTAWGYTGATLSGSTAATGFQQGLLADWNSSGAGVVSGNKEGSSPHHAFDSITSGCSGSIGTVGGVTPSSVNSGCGGKIEGMLLNFGTTKVNLSDVGIGWTGGDADLSVWAYTGAGAAPTSMASTMAQGSDTTTETFAAALSGWTLVSNHNMSTAATQSTGSSLYSSAFLITTYFGAATSTLNAGNDSFKLNKVTVGLCAGTVSTAGACTVTPPSSVSAPGTLALAGLGLLGGAFVRRRKA